MRLLDVITAPWAILPEKLQEIQAIYLTHLRGEKIDLKAIEAKLGEPLQNQQDGYEVINGVAVLPLEGVLAKRMNLFTKISGGTSTELFARDFREALGRSDVRAIVLAIDSPGGTIDGTQHLADLIYAGRGTKPIVAVANGMIASAAYWIGTAAETVLIEDDTTVAGSIGVVAQHVDVSKAEEQAGLKTTEIVAGKFKRIASQYAPLSEIGRATMQDMVDHFYSVFVTDVATYRGTTVESVVTDMADGRIFIGQRALAAGLVDGVATLEEVINDLAAGGAKYGKEMTPMGKLIIEEPVTVARLTEQCPDLVADIRQAGLQEGMANGKTEGLAAGAEAERRRIQEVEAQCLAGHEALITRLKYDGKTTGPEAAVQILAAERALSQTHLQQIKTEAPPPAPQPPVSAMEPDTDLDSKKERAIHDYQRQHACAYRDAVLAVSRAHPELFTAEA